MKNRVLNEMKKEYVNILCSLYPSKGSTGFTERNLSVNFASAYKVLNDKAVAWFEFSFGKNNHFDAIIVDPSKKKLVIVESKRFTNPRDKAKEIDEDIERIQELNSEERLEKEFGKRLPNWRDYSIYGTIIADIWTENDVKIGVFNCFRSMTGNATA